MANDLPGRATISLAGIEPDTLLPGRWRNWVALGIPLFILACLLATEAPPPGSTAPVLSRLIWPVDPFFGWLTTVLGASLCLAVALDRWLVRRSSRVEIDRAGRSIRILRGGLWSRRNEVAPLGGVRDLALVETLGEAAAAWRLELRWMRAAGREPLVVAATHDVGRLEAVARRIAQEAQLELARERAVATPSRSG